MLVQVYVRPGEDGKSAMRRLRQIMQAEGILKQVRARRYNVSPSELKAEKTRQTAKKKRRAFREQMHSYAY